MRHLVLTFLFFSTIGWAQFAPAAGQIGSTAIESASKQFVNWATGCVVERGFINLSNTDLGKAAAGTELSACGQALENGAVSLGDAGSAILTFPLGIMNGPGYDFAVFENSFSDDFLELAFVEVSSDGINFFRFSAVSNTQTTQQIETFGLLDATKLNNLAGKYRSGYGTPFDLEELKNTPGLDISRITHVKIIDVVGSINDPYGTKDANNNLINDPFPTAFDSGGFDLDAVGVIHQNSVAGIKANAHVNNYLLCYPNPANSVEGVYFTSISEEKIQLIIFNLRGDRILNEEIYPKMNTTIFFTRGIYLVQVIDNKGLILETKKLIVNE